MLNLSNCNRQILVNLDDLSERLSKHVIIRINRQGLILIKQNRVILKNHVLNSKWSSNFFSSLSRAYKTYPGEGGEGIQDRFTHFPKFDNNDIISAKSSFYCFFIRTLFGVVGGGMQKVYILYAHENDEKMDDPYASAITKHR